MFGLRIGHCGQAPFSLHRRFADTKTTYDSWPNDNWGNNNYDSGMSDANNSESTRPSTQTSNTDPSHSWDNEDQQNTNDKPTLPNISASANIEQEFVYPFYLSRLANGHSFSKVVQKIPRPKLRRAADKTAKNEHSPIKIVAAAAATDAGDEAGDDPVISFHIPVPTEAADADDDDHQMSVASSGNADPPLYGPSNENDVDENRRLSVASSVVSTTGSPPDDLIYLCVNLQKEYADNPTLFNQRECSQQVYDSSATFSSRQSGSQAGSVKLHDCLKTFLQPERLSEREMWFCKQCKEHKRAEKKLDLWDLPAYLIIHLKRFNYSRWWREKLRQRVVIPEELDMSPYVKNPAHVQPVMYDFVGVSNHTGGLAAGHYWAHAKDRDGNWVKLNDSFANQSSYMDAAGRDVSCACFFFLKFSCFSRTIKLFLCVRRATKLVI